MGIRPKIATFENDAAKPVSGKGNDKHPKVARMRLVISPNVEDMYSVMSTNFSIWLT
jgi:hypothetical protein